MSGTTEWHSVKYWRNRSPKERLENARLPKRYRNSSFESYDLETGDANAVNAINLWLADAEDNIANGMGLFLFGSAGVGKTHLAAAILRNIVTNHQLSGSFVTADTYLEMMYDEMRNDGELPEMYADPNLSKYFKRTFDLLVLDALGEEKATDFSRKAVTTLVESRYNNQLPMIVTSAYNPSSIKRLYGDRFSSILFDCCLVIPVHGSDHRLGSSVVR
jgi:DNA replication protein DnaC